MTYNDWISEHYPTPDSARLRCAEATAEMCDSFPELNRARGHVLVGVQYRPHWWCESPAGEVIDPTAHQWESPPIVYERLESEEEPHGKCMYCGDRSEEHTSELQSRGHLVCRLLLE